MSVHLSSKVKIGISACMYGCHYRYNNKGWEQLDFIGRDRGEFIWYPVCPEVNAGLGVPREAIRITGENGSSVWEGHGKIMSSSGKDLSKKLMDSCDWCLKSLKDAGVQVFIYTEGSPSCGVYRTTLKNKRLGKPPGLFGDLLLREGFFLIPAQDLTSPIRWWDWRRRMLAFSWLKEQPLKDKNDLYAIWHVLKFLCQEIDEKQSREIGKELAGFDKHTGNDPVLLEGYRTQLVEILRQPSAVAKIKNRLWKHYKHFMKATGQEIEEVQDPMALRNMTELAHELLLMELKSMETGVLFGASPVTTRRPPKKAVPEQNSDEVTEEDKEEEND